MLAVWAEFGPMLEGLLGKPISVNRDDWRPGDQRVFYADVRKAKNDLGWEPRIGLKRWDQASLRLGAGEQGPLLGHSFPQTRQD